MAYLKPHSRYSSYDTRSSTSSHFSDPSSSTELKLKSAVTANTSSSRALVVKSSKPSDLSSRAKSKPSNSNPPNLNLASMVKKFMEKKSSSSSSSSTKAVKLVIPSDVIGDDLKKTARKGTSFTGLHRKLFGNGNETAAFEDKKKKKVKALTEVKENTRTLAMVLRSERELLGMNKEQEMEIAQLKFMLEEKSTEVEKLKDLCLKQREEIKALKSTILFPDFMNSQHQGLLEKQDSELKQAKQLIPTLQRQVTSLTGQLQCLAEDLAEDFSSGDPTTPGSPDDMFLKDLNPCLTPYAKTKSKEFEAMGYYSPEDEFLFENNMEIGFNSQVRKMSKSSDCCQNVNTGSTITRGVRRSDETKCTYGKQMHHKLF
uniref:Uncharacterized protein n=1 Tax=Fagus sylvatica TaxID=28930 RepID=A0A2N9IJ28_FAGSY